MKHNMIENEGHAMTEQPAKRDLYSYIIAEVKP